MIMTFGKYKGQNIEDIPTTYLVWALENASGLSIQMINEMESQLDARDGKGIDRGKNESI